MLDYLFATPADAYAYFAALVLVFILGCCCHAWWAEIKAAK